MATTEMKTARPSDLTVRFFAALGMALAAIGAVWLGGIALWLFVSAGAMLMVAEWAGMMRAPRWKTMLGLALLGLVMIGARFLLDQSYQIVGDSRQAFLAMLGVAGGAGILLAVLSLSPRLGAGLLYAGVPALSLLYLRDQPQGVALALWTVSIVSATDIGAYFAGRSIGGPKLAPRISPNKTWAGLIGGVVAAALTGALLASLFGLPLLLGALGGGLAVLAQLGDLFESWLKRRAGVKDSGTVLPGHGGVLDRLDGLVPVATLVAMLIAADVL
jgi:phosphatidate cytidylyltransferase